MTEPAPQIATFRDLYVKGWDGMSDPSTLTPADLLSIDQFQDPQTTDRMAVGYLVPGAPTFPLLKLEALPALVSAGQEPLLHWAMLDIDNEGHRPWKSLAEAEEFIENSEGAFDYFDYYTTRAGFRLVTRLDPPLPVSLSHSFFRLLSSTTTLKVDAACYDWTRRFRLPRACRDGQVLESAIELDPSVSIDPFALAKDCNWELTTAAPVPVAMDLPLPEVHELTWDDRRHAAGFDWLLRGEPIPTDKTGSSFPVLRTTLAIVAERGKYDDPETLYSFIASSAVATVGSSVSDTDQVWRLCCWIAERQGVANAERESTAPNPDALPPMVALTPSEWAVVRKSLRGKASKFFPLLRDGSPLHYHKNHHVTTTWTVARTLAEHSDLPPDAIYRTIQPSATAQKAPQLPDLWEKILELHEEREAEGDEDTQIRRAFVAMHPLTLATTAGRLYQLDTPSGEYVVTTETLIEHHFENHTKPGLPFEADYTGVALRSVLARYGGGIGSVVYVSGLKGITYNPADSKMIEGVHNLARVSAVEHPDVGGWLELLGGTDPDGLLDWLACVTYTYDQPLCALYINGAPGIGKTFLARGIASLWNSAPGNYNKATNGDFNAEMLQSPLLFADEGIVVNRNNEEMASIAFRNIVAGQGVGINAKYQAVMPLVGALRVLICANHTNGLPFKESLGKDGIEAITQRVMYIHVDDAPKRYLEALGGRNALTEWAPADCSPGKIAEHLMWLKKTRTVAPGRRFMVEGRHTPWHSKYAARQGIKPYVLQVIWNMCEDARKTGKPLRVEWDALEDKVWISAADLKARWEDYTKVRRPRPAAIVDALEQLSDDKQRRTMTNRARAHCYGIPVRAFLDANVCEKEDMYPETDEEE